MHISSKLLGWMQYLHLKNAWRKKRQGKKDFLILFFLNNGESHGWKSVLLRATADTGKPRSVRYAMHWRALTHTSCQVVHEHVDMSAAHGGAGRRSSAVVLSWSSMVSTNGSSTDLCGQLKHETHRWRETFILIPLLLRVFDHSLFSCVASERLFPVH